MLQGKINEMTQGQIQTIKCPMKSKISLTNENSILIFEFQALTLMNGKNDTRKRKQMIKV
jgi:hypothetical protein